MGPGKKTPENRLSHNEAHLILNNVKSSSDQSKWKIMKNRMISLQYCFQYVSIYVSSTAMVIGKRGLGLNYKPKDWRSPGSN